MRDIGEPAVVIIGKPTVYTEKLAELILANGYEVLTIDIALEEVTDFLQKQKNVQLLILDIAYTKKDASMIKKIKKLSSIPIIILSSRSVHDTAQTVYAIADGANDFIICERLTETSYLQDIEKKILHALDSKSLIKPSRKKQKKKAYREVKKKHSPKKRPKKSQDFTHIVAIGTSTGGPNALQTVMKNIPKDFPAPIVIVQHMPAGFTRSLAKRLDEICEIHVKEATNNESLQAGTAYIAPGENHMEITDDCRIRIYHDDVNVGHQPSVNVLFESIARLHHLEKVAVILTGMGKDGSKGIRKLKEADDDTVVIVESEETAVIFGMPRAAIRTGHVTEVSRLEDVSEIIVHYVMERGI